MIADAQAFAGGIINLDINSVFTKKDVADVLQIIEEKLSKLNNVNTKESRNAVKLLNSAKAKYEAQLQRLSNSNLLKTEAEAFEKKLKNINSSSEKEVRAFLNEADDRLRELKSAGFDDKDSVVVVLLNKAQKSASKMMETIRRSNVADFLNKTKASLQAEISGIEAKIKTASEITDVAELTQKLNFTKEKLKNLEELVKKRGLIPSEFSLDRYTVKTLKTAAAAKPVPARVNCTFTPQELQSLGKSIEYFDIQNFASMLKSSDFSKMPQQDAWKLYKDSKSVIKKTQNLIEIYRYSAENVGDANLKNRYAYAAQTLENSLSSIQTQRKSLKDSLAGEITDQKVVDYLKKNASDDYDKFYDSCRGCKNDTYGVKISEDDFIFFRDKHIADLTGVENRGIKVIKNGWHHRKNPNFKKDFGFPGAVDRISLNVYADKKLIDKLDDFMLNNPSVIEYKTPSTFVDWECRHDPITIYFDDFVTDDVKRRVADLVKPYVRTQINPSKEIMFGTKIADGVYSLPEPAAENCSDLLDKMYLLDKKGLFDVYKKKILDYDSKGNVKTYYDGSACYHSSPGSIEAIRKLVAKIESMLNNP